MNYHQIIPNNRKNFKFDKYYNNKNEKYPNFMNKEIVPNINNNSIYLPNNQNMVQMPFPNFIHNNKVNKILKNNYKRSNFNQTLPEEITKLNLSNINNIFKKTNIDKEENLQLYKKNSQQEFLENINILKESSQDRNFPDKFLIIPNRNKDLRNYYLNKNVDKKNRNIIKDLNKESTIINPKFIQKNFTSEKFNERIKYCEFKGIFDCDSVEEISIIDCSKLSRNSNASIIIAENNDINSLLFQFFYLLFFSRKYKKIPSLFPIEITSLNGNILSLRNCEFSSYSSKIIKSLDYINLKFSNQLETLNQEIKSLVKIKKTPPQDVFSFSRLVCIYYRYLIIAFLFNQNIDTIKMEFKIENIDKLIEYLFDLSKNYENCEEIITLLCRILNIPNIKYTNNFNKDFIKEIGIIDYGIIEIIEENRKSLYGIISKKLYKQYNLDINTKNHNLENKMKLFSNYL